MTPPRLKPVFDSIDAERQSLVDAVSKLVSIPSVAGDPESLTAAAAATADLCAGAGFKTEIWDGPAAPTVFAEYAGPPGAPTVLFYGHYDVQPAAPLSAWESPPFEPTVRDGSLFGRGAGDNKGQYAPHVFGVRALAESGGCPVNVKLLIEGEEEVGSPGLSTVVTQHREHLACDLAVTADGPYHADGTPLLITGVRGLVFLELTARGADRDLHSGSNGGVAPTPARTLTSALTSLWDAEGRVAVPGFYDNVQLPGDADREAAAALPAPAGATSAHWSRLMFEPNLNIAGIDSGHIGRGVKTVIPHVARAKLDIRLVANQDPDDIIGKLRSFLQPWDVEVEALAAVPPSRTALDNPFTAAVEDAIVAAWGRSPYRQPSLGGTTPDFVFTQLLGVPSILVPYAPADMHHHAPNERIGVDDLTRGARTSAAICVGLAGPAL